MVQISLDTHLVDNSNLIYQNYFFLCLNICWNKIFCLFHYVFDVFN